VEGFRKVTEAGTPLPGMGVAFAAWSAFAGRHLLARVKSVLSAPLRGTVIEAASRVLAISMARQSGPGSRSVPDAETRRPVILSSAARAISLAYRGDGLSRKAAVSRAVPGMSSLPERISLSSPVRGISHHLSDQRWTTATSPVLPLSRPISRKAVIWHI